MAELPQVRPERLVRALKRAGFNVARTTGSHVILERADGCYANLPMHSGRDVPRGLLARILKTAGLTAEDLRKLL